jgi:hypothetical protein
MMWNDIPHLFTSVVSRFTPIIGNKRELRSRYIRKLSGISVPLID